MVDIEITVTFTQLSRFAVDRIRTQNEGEAVLKKKPLVSVGVKRAGQEEVEVQSKHRVSSPAKSGTIHMTSALHFSTLLMGCGSVNMYLQSLYTG